MTVLTAVYNAEKYLPQCLDSILGQSMTNLQLVCIDDASTDKSPLILKEYAAKDSRVRLVTHDVNTGQAVARNDGLKYADGDYVIMVDADDWLSDNALETAAMALDNDSRLGCVLLNLTYVYDDGHSKPYPMRTDKMVWTGREAFGLSLDWSVHGLYMARMELYRKWPFDTSTRLYSDDNTTRIHYLNSVLVGSCKGTYYYRQHSDSMTNSANPLRYDLLEANSSMARQIRGLEIPAGVLSRFERERWVNLTGICIWWLEHDAKTADMAFNSEVKRRLERAYDDIDKSLLPSGLKRKVGYRPCNSFEGWLRQVKFYNMLRKTVRFAKK